MEVKFNNKQFVTLLFNKLPWKVSIPDVSGVTNVSKLGRPPDTYHFGSTVGDDVVIASCLKQIVGHLAIGSQPAILFPLSLIVDFRAYDKASLNLSVINVLEISHYKIFQSVSTEAYSLDVMWKYCLIIIV